MRSLYRSLAGCALAAALAFGSSGCAVSRMADNLHYGILDSDDPQLAAAALPAYMLTVDGLLVTWPKHVGLLRSASSLYGAYATLATTDSQRAGKLTERALHYALRAACADKRQACALRTDDFSGFEAVLQKARAADLPTLFALGSAWAGYIQQHSDDWNAVAELARVQLIFERILVLDPDYEQGMPQLYLGVIHSLLPPALGGKPAVAQRYYEQAMLKAGPRNLFVKMMYAKQYARLLYDRELHDRLLNEVLLADPAAHGLTLLNVYAQDEARRLLLDAEEYF